MRSPVPFWSIQSCDRLFHFRQLYWAQRFKPKATRPSVGAGFTDNLSTKTGNLCKPALFVALLMNKGGLLLQSAIAFFSPTPVR
ncbi:hypothetical protein [Coleofasciculus sp. F4-SAH-05]|uniref:hypothetical protein n=1 Tax=Coleofasciculus sp. F4-SAH-05 TaxID=3069525 RepID=UPI0032F21B39